MKCEPIQTPPADAIDIPALRERYRRERDQRIRREGQDQYVKTQDDFASSYEADPHMPVQPRAPIHERSEEHTSEPQSLMRLSSAAVCSKQQTTTSIVPRPSIVARTSSVSTRSGIHSYLLPSYERGPCQRRVQQN